MQMFINSLYLALNSSEANIQQAFGTLQAIGTLSAGVAKNLTDVSMPLQYGSTQNTCHNLFSFLGQRWNSKRH